jgi:zinc D-Ala-D-Ala dipeptidase
MMEARKGKMDKSLKDHRSSSLVDVTTLHPNIRVELKYASTENFTRKAIYNFTRCFLQREVALALAKVQTSLEELSLGLKVWDGYRPVAAQWKLWESCPDPRFVRHPAIGSCHSRGASVDVTLVTKEGCDLIMPSDFDDFSERASVHYLKAPQEALKNRDLLQKAMQNAGFLRYELEWWHFDFHTWESFPLISDFHENLI